MKQIRLLQRKEDKYFQDYIEHNNLNSFNKLYLLISPWLVKMIYQITLDMEIAKDIEQDSWVAIVNLRKRNNNKLGSITNLIFTIAKNNALMWKRQNRNAMQFSRELFNMQKTQYNSHDEFEKFEITQFVHDAISMLPDYYQEVVILYHLVEMKITDISYKLELSEGTVKSRLKRAKEQLELILINNFKEEIST